MPTSRECNEIAASRPQVSTLDGALSEAGLEEAPIAVIKIDAEG